MNTIIKIGATAAGLWVAIWLLGGLDFEGELVDFLIVTLLIVGINTFIRPIIKFLSFPVILVTLGLFALIVNAAMLQLVVWLSSPDRFGLNFTSDGFFWSTFLGAIVIAIVKTVVENILGDD